MRTARAVPIMEVRITYKIPKDGSAEAGCQTVPKRSSLTPTLRSAGVPFINMYMVMDATAKTAKKAQTVKMISAAISAISLLALLP